MPSRKRSKLRLFQMKYGAFVIALLSVYCMSIYWGKSWFLVTLFSLGTIICSAIGISEVQESKEK